MSDQPIKCEMKCSECGRVPCSGAKSLQKSATDMSKEKVRLSERNTTRLMKVAKAMEIDPEVLLNNYLMTGLEDPYAFADCMDFTEGGKIGKTEAKAARERVLTRATELADEGWEANGKD